MASSKAKNAAHLAIRNKLQAEGRKVTAEVSQLMIETATKEDLVRAKAIAETYVNIRQSLTPDIASDGYTNSLSGKAKLAEKRIVEGSDSPNRTNK